MAKQNLIILGFFLLFLFSTTFPGLLHLNDKLFGDGGDNYQYSSLQYVFRQQILSFNNPLSHTNLYRYPNGFNMANSSDGLFANTTGAIIGMFLPHTLSFNLTVILIIFLNFFSAYYVTHKVTNNSALSLLGAIIFGFSNYTLVRAPNHLNLGFVAGIPLYYLGLREFFNSKISPNYYLGIGLLLSALGSLQYLSILFVFTVLYTIFHIQSFTIKPKSLVPTIVSCLLIVTIFNSTFLALINNQLTYDDRDTILKENITSPQDLLLPSQYQTFWYTPLIHSKNYDVEHSIFLGFPEIIILGLLLITFLKKNRSLFFTTLLLVIFSTGIFYKYLFSLPIFNTVPEPGRFSILLIAILSVEFPLLLSKQKDKLQSIILFFTLFLLFLGHLTFNFYQSPDLNKPELSAIKNLPGKAVLNLPITIFDPKRNQEAVYHQKSIVDGYLHRIGNAIPSATNFIGDPLFNRFICDTRDHEKFAILYDQKILNQKTISLMKKLQINTIVLHKGDPYLFEECSVTRAIIQQFIPETETITQGQNQIYSKEYSNTPHLYQKLFFPQKGTFYLNGLLVNPIELGTIEIYHNDKNLNGYYFEEGNDGLTLNPTDTLAYEVESGDTIDIFSPTDLFKTAWLTLWYGFTPDASSSASSKPTIYKLFEDSQTAVYQLN